MRNLTSVRHWLADARGILIGAGALYALLYVLLWPASWTSMDESCYLGLAATLRHGTIYPDAAGLSVVTTFPVGLHLVSKYPPGMPLLLAGASLLGWKAALGTNLAVHLLTFAAVARLLRRMAAPQLFALLFLLHPTAVLYSRTVMADPVSGLLLALAFENSLLRRPALCGALVGSAVLCRTGNALALPVFLAALLWEGKQCACPERQGFGRAVSVAKGALAFLAGAAPFLGVWAWYAFVIAGGQMAQHTGTFGLVNFPQMFPGYLLGLLLIYPGLLLAPACYRGPGRAVLAALCYGTVLLYSFWYYRDGGGSLSGMLIAGQRYFLAVLPLLIAAYGAWLSPWMRGWPARPRRDLSAAACLGLFCLAAAVSLRHAGYVAQMAATQTALGRIVRPGDLLLCSAQVGKTLRPGEQRRRILLLGGPLTAPETSEIAEAVQAAQDRPGARVFAAAAVRPGRSDDVRDASYLPRLLTGYAARPLTGDERRGLPPEVMIFQIFSPHPSKIRELAGNLH